ncbi:MAG: hypothetical protein K0R39_4440 [Symbiobacteriaceae bacterium]|nr:hypothetical protein [Symbiobacteriaceae bacterium]
MSRAAVSPSAGLDYHSVHTLIPIGPLANSLGIFFNNTPSPSPFCRGGFRGRLPRSQLAGFLRGIADRSGPVPCLIHHTHSRQATLLPAPHHVSAPRSRSSLRRSPVARNWCNRHVYRRPPRKEGRRPHAIADRPSSRRSGVLLTVDRIPSSSPRLGIGGHHQRPHRCALDGFLGPPSEKVVPTRILRHPKPNHNIRYPSRSTTNRASLTR